MNPRRTNISAARAVIMLLMGMLVTAFAAQAAPVTYTFSGTASGSVNGSPFSNSAFTIRVFADTNAVVLVPSSATIWSVEDISSEFDITGIGAGVFTVDERVFNNASLAILGFAHSHSRDSFDLIDLGDPAFGTYDLKTSFGPVFVANPFVSTFVFNEPSTLGNVILTSASDVTFTAQVIPEPTTGLLFGLGIIIALGLNMSRLRAASYDRG